MMKFWSGETQRPGVRVPSTPLRFIISYFLILTMPKAKDVMRSFIVEVDTESYIKEVASLMKEKKVGSVIVKKDNNPIGIITERDVLYKVVAEGKDPSKVKAKEIMSSPLITVDKETDLEEVLKIFKEKGIRRLPVKEGDKIVGIITLRSIIGDLRSVEEVTKDFEKIQGYICAFCGSVFPTEKDLSKHIDRVHIGAGILEGRR